MASTGFQSVGREYTFSAAASAPVTLTNSQLLALTSGNTFGPNGDHTTPAQFITVFAQTSGAAATATLQFMCVDDDSLTGAGSGKLWQDTAAIVGGATRTSHNTTAGGYVATVVFTISGKNTLDVHPVGKFWPKWYVACTALSAGTLTIQVVPGRAI